MSNDRTPRTKPGSPSHVKQVLPPWIAARGTRLGRASGQDAGAAVTGAHRGSPGQERSPEQSGAGLEPQKDLRTQAHEDPQAQAQDRARRLGASMRRCDLAAVILDSVLVRECGHTAYDLAAPDRMEVHLAIVGLTGKPVMDRSDLAALRQKVAAYTLARERAFASHCHDFSMMSARLTAGGQRAWRRLRESQWDCIEALCERFAGALSAGEGARCGAVHPASAQAVMRRHIQADLMRQPITVALVMVLGAHGAKLFVDFACCENLPS